MRLPYRREFEQMVEAKYGPSNAEECIFFMKLFFRFCPREPYNISKQDMLDFLTWMVQEYGVKPGTLEKAVTALKLYFVEFRHIRVAGVNKAQLEKKLSKI